MPKPKAKGRAGTAPYPMLRINMSNVTLDQDQSLELIQLYAHFRVLWDTNNPNHFKYIKREYAWREISEALDLPIPTLKAKMKSLMGTYRSEKSREKKSRLIEKDADCIYESKWFAFRSFDFLSDRDNPKDADTIAKEQADFTVLIKEEPQEVPQTFTIEGQETGSETTPVEDAAPLVAPTPSAPPKRRALTATELLMSKRRAAKSRKVGEGQLRPLKGDGTVDMNDSYFTYGLHLANELRKYDTQTLAHVKRAISEIFFEADMGRMSYDTPASPQAQDYFTETSHEFLCDTSVKKEDP